MATRREITCIRKTNRSSAHDCIEQVGGGSGTTRWRLSQKGAIDGIESKTYELYVIKNGSFVNVIVAVSASGNKYIKTQNDGEQPNNLLSLPECQ